MELAYLVVTVIASVYTARLFQTPFNDGDLFWQKHLGAYVLQHHALPTALGSETFTASGAAWTPQEWLLGIAADLAMSHHALWILAVCAGLVLAATLAIVARRAHAFGGSLRAVAIVTILCAIDMEGAFGIRAQVFVWPLFAAVLLCLDLSGPRVFLTLLAVAAWANVHASVMLAIPIVWIDAAVALWRRGIGEADTRGRLALSALVPFATLLTPLGVRLPEYAVTLVRSPIRASIDEWQPITFHHAFFWIGAMPMVVFAAIAVRALWRERPRDVVWAGLLFAMTLMAVRNAALLGIVVAPLAARAMDLVLARWEWWRREPSVQKGSPLAGIVSVVAVSTAAFFVTIWLPPQKDSWVPPLATFDRLAATAQPRRVFCYDFSVCSIALDHPNLRVFMDGRADPYPLWVWHDFNVIRKTQPGWLQLLDSYRVDTVVARRGDFLDRALTKQPGWTALPKLDRCCQAYVRPN